VAPTPTVVADLDAHFVAEFISGHCEMHLRIAGTERRLQRSRTPTPPISNLHASVAMCPGIRAFLGIWMLLDNHEIPKNGQTSQVLLSSGMSGWADLDRAVERLRGAAAGPLAVLQCTSSYPVRHRRWTRMPWPWSWARTNAGWR
jgi:hypothetical protein